MKRSWQLAALVAILSLASWLDSPGTARASLPYCADYAMKSCSPDDPLFLCDYHVFPYPTYVCECTLFQGSYIWECAP